MFNSSHIGRSFGNGRWIEEACPCPKEQCGLVSVDRVDPNCDQHSFSAARTIRQSHLPENCRPMEVEQNFEK